MIQLPRLHRATDYTPRPVRNTSVQTAATGGARLPINRGGDHWAMEIDVGAMSAQCGRELVADILLGIGQTVRAYLPQSGIETGALGLPKVAGADQFGESLDIDGITPNQVIRKGWWVTIITGGRGRLYLTTSEVIADADGEATLTLWPPLRASADNDVVEITDPFIEGVISEGGEHGAGLVKALTLQSFTVEELD